MLVVYGKKEQLNVKVAGLGVLADIHEAASISLLQVCKVVEILYIYVVSECIVAHQYAL